ncbi:MAG: hypothetical protein O2817_12370 [Proteobacteria bacterium]|nr:hypothetical protein [Pseudomonadota bacterium]
MRSWPTFVAVWLAASLLGVSAVSAEAVKVRGGIRDDYARIVFTWDTPVSHKIALDGDRLSVRFDRPIEASFGRVTQTLGKYISSADPGDDDRSVVFGLKDDFEVYSFDSGSAVIVEIVEKEGADNTPEKTSDKTPGQEPGLALVRVRTGQHADYTRLVFDWPKKVPYSFKQDGGIATVTFSSPAKIDLKALQSRPLRLVGAVRSSVGDDSVTITLSVPASSKVKHFLAGNKVVLDIGRPSGSEKPVPLPPEEKSAALLPEEKTEPKEAKEAKKAKSPEPSPTPEKKPEPEKAPEKIASAAEPAANVIQEKTKSEAKSAAATPAAPAAPRALIPSTTPPSPPTPAQVTAQVTPQETTKETTKETTQASPAAEILVSLRFDWNEPVGAAVFRRAGFLWVAFDKPTAIDVDQLRQAGGTVIEGIEQMGTEQATVLRMATKEGINPGLRRDGLAWLLDFSKQPIAAQTGLDVKAQPDSPIGSRLFVSVPEPGTPIGVTDPEVGDNIVIIPVIPLGHGTDLEYTYPQLRFLPTSQGLVVQPRVDDIRVRSLREGLEVSSGNELRISSVSAEAAAQQKLSSMRPLSRILDLGKWEVKALEGLKSRRHELYGAVAQAKKGPALEAARLDLIRFFLANGFYAESMGVLNEAAKTRAEIDQMPEYRMLRGVAQYRMGRLTEAYNDLNHDKLRLNDEAVFWRAAVRAASGDLKTAAIDIRRTGQIIRPYPKSLKTPMGRLVIETALDIGDIKQANHILEIIRLDDLSPAEVTQFDFEEGRVLELTGDFDGAVAIWDKVIKGHHRPTQARAVVARMELLLKLGRMEKKEAIKDLEKLRFSWRGDEFEFSLLRRLGGLYLDEGLFRQGLDRLRQAATYFRTHEEAPLVTQKMSDAFSELYLKGRADTLAPIRSIAIYDEFKELTPAGALGDEMIRKLADRLVGVDLLDRAETLLNSQVRFRLQGLEKTRVGAQLALVHIMAREYTKALKALDDTVSPNIPEKMAAQRRHVRAKILMELKRRDEALELLKRDKSEDAEKLRAEAYWSSRSWSKAALSLSRLIKDTGSKASAPVDEKQAAYVLNYAIALTLGGNQRALARLKNDYGAAMAKTNLNDAFRLIVTPDNFGLMAPGDVSSRVKDIEKFQTFMQAYRERLKKQNLSDLVPALNVADEKKPAATPAPAASPPTSPAAKPQAQAPAEAAPPKS